MNETNQEQNFEYQKSVLNEREEFRGLWCQKPRKDQIKAIQKFCFDLEKSEGR